MSGQVISRPIHPPAVLNEVFTRHLLTAEECSEVARKGRRGREDHLCQVLLTKPAEILQEAVPVLEEHGFDVEELKSELSPIFIPRGKPVLECSQGIITGRISLLPG